VGELKAVTETLKTYLEAVMVGIGKDDSTRLIESEEKRLEESKRLEQARSNDWCVHVARTLDIPIEKVIDVIKNAKSASGFVDALAGEERSKEAKRDILSTLYSSREARRDFNEARAILGVPRIDWGDLIDDEQFVDPEDLMRSDSSRKSKKIRVVKKVVA